MFPNLPIYQTKNDLPGSAQDKAMVFLMGVATENDNMGGLFQYSDTAADSVDDRNVLAVPGKSTGRYIRKNAKTVVLPHGIIAFLGSLKLFFTTANYTIGSDSKCMLYLTQDNTAAGTALFSQILWNSSRAIGTAATSNDIILSQAETLPVDLKSTTHIYARGNSTTIGATITALLNTVLPGLRAGSIGTSVQFFIVGI